MSPLSSQEILLTSSPDGPITAYDSSSGVVLTNFAAIRSPRQGLVLVGQTSFAASNICPITASSSIKLYNWWSSSTFFNIPVPEPVGPLAASSDGAFLFAGSISGSLYVISLPSGDILNSFASHSKPVSCLNVSEDDSLLISGSDDGTIVVLPIFQVVSSTLTSKNNVGNLALNKFIAHSGPVTAATFGTSLCNSQVISSSMDRTIKFWSLLRGILLSSVSFPCPIMSFVLDPTETGFYGAGSDGSIYKGWVQIGKNVKHVNGNELIRLTENHNSSIISLVMVNNGRNLVSASEDGSVWMWELDYGQVAMALRNGNKISDLVVARGISYMKGNGNGNGVRVSINNCGNWGGGFSGEELVRSGLAEKNVMKIEEVISEVENDKRRAIDMLESSIFLYERLLELMLKEAEGECSTTELVKKEDIN
ncbi:hypothetical protein UlMin_027262 [Ulmus minor]